MADSYVLKGTENEYLLVIRAEDEKAIYFVIDALSASRNEQIKEVAVELEKSLHDNGRDSSKIRSKNKSKVTTSNNSKRRKAKNA
jgi:thioesterase domain-containing protein